MLYLVSSVHHLLFRRHLTHDELAVWCIACLITTSWSTLVTLNRAFGSGEPLANSNVVWLLTIHLLWVHVLLLITTSVGGEHLDRLTVEALKTLYILHLRCPWHPRGIHLLLELAIVLSVERMRDTWVHHLVCTAIVRHHRLLL